ncbi:hypothetical protein ANME2D_01329 [Candidatus Methanoperedens nitroreducens]|uniref:DUF4367 domain-containing protein n=1 Tax=Candidatus Methanoperedens nitratireducens TaxID=1392998 RepID=A0A062V8M8_9EURY|nr:DUF4367 domain-containing protein [Candidatus Methanoperedens nitroreducens]KCZ72893.1 hypothetical protein ANME2D_01329 [Candidatus Methanoperedens nitroreducens]MDJ1423179.1 DUF4367 domain-containing protein [Candidatus Methanoperedens sp.]
MKKSILIGVSIVTVLGILLAAVALGFAETNTKFNAFTGAEDSRQVTKKAIAEAQANVSFTILEPDYLPSGYKFESARGTKFVGVLSDIDMASFSYKNGDEQLTIKEIIVVKTKDNITQPSTLPRDTREIVDINGIEGRYSEENGIKFLGWKIGNLSLSITSWKNEGQTQATSSLGKEEMIKMAGSVK